MSRKWGNWYQNEVDEEIKGADSRDKVKHNERSDQLFLGRGVQRPFELRSKRIRIVRGGQFFLLQGEFFCTLRVYCNSTNLLLYFM